MFTIWKKIGSGWGSINVSCQLTPPRPSKKGSKLFGSNRSQIGRRITLGTLRSDDGGCLRRRAEVGNICLRISGSRRVRFPALAVLSETSKRSVCRLV